MKKIIIIAVGAILLVGGGIGGALFFLKSPEEMPEGEMMSEEEKVPEAKDAIYEDIHPPFTINFAEGSKKNFMQISMVAKFYSMDARDKFKMHVPVVRNNLLLLMSGKNSDELTSNDAKEKLRKDVLMTAQTVMKDLYDEDLVEDIYFTKLVMQ